MPAARYPRRQLMPAAWPCGTLATEWRTPGTRLFPTDKSITLMGGGAVQEGDETPRKEKRSEPQILASIGQRNMPARFARYVATAASTATSTRASSACPAFAGRPCSAPPDVIYDDKLEIKVGGVAFELNHARGETDDHTWTWMPHRKVIVAGDFVIWAAPNSGNPQKVQRYTKDWAEAFRAWPAKEADALIRGTVGDLRRRSRRHPARRRRGVAGYDPRPGDGDDERGQDARRRFVNAVKFPADLFAQRSLPAADRR